MPKTLVVLPWIHGAMLFHIFNSLSVFDEMSILASVSCPSCGIKKETPLVQGFENFWFS